ncbi:MetQ/NlpA family ABC transporter substrate-binding protein [Succinivibrio faecicola]|uniref:MetQ/NlpA family ABC transporter substrate-binding protein n=1 Tax=Succinivibrio faecicola TaxID=2820300 RepID=A0ABS7DE26_9GAMM|nr:MetQ/NlpA family ABC transporter substrate-binding protein [Succinivibrio faecicola]MBW7569361.1 MetQ/NlpA family ABC transporter substrate-binding protein [Succinivibrio faecicola]
MKKLLLSVAALVLSFSSNAAETLTIGASPVPHVEILEVVKPDLKAQGIDLKIVEFNDYVQPNTSVSDKLLDLNFFQHRPYLDSFIKDHGSDLVEVGGIHIEPIGFYSHKLKDLKDLKKGATIAIPNDPTNGGRALLLLQTAGLITLEDPKAISATPLDIKENKLNLNIKELEAPQLPRSLDDVDGAIINTNYAIDAGLNPLKDALFIENADSPYVNVVVGNSVSVKKDSVKALLKALQSDKVKKFINDKYNGAVVAAF